MTPVTLLVTALALDSFLGDPPLSFHPVRGMGRLISFLDIRLFHPGRLGLLTGTLLTSLVPFCVLCVYLLIRGPLLLLPGFLPNSMTLWLGFGIDVLVLYSCIAFRDLFDHARPIAEALEGDDLPGAQDALQRIVGRDARRLDKAGVARAATESVAESLSDGLIGPLFWFTVCGAGATLWIGAPAPSAGMAAVAGALCFRAANTLDSMVGHRSERYLCFGRASARWDDGLCFLPSRFTLLGLISAALSLGLDARGGLRIWWRDRGLHPSPNAGQSESFTAGALGLRLGGPVTYPYGVSERPWLGDGDTEAKAADLRAACDLIFRAGWSSAAFLCLLLWLVQHLVLSSSNPF